MELLGPNAAIGVDTQFFTVTNFLKGIKNIPPGLHLVHYSESVETGSSIRYGWWIQFEEGEVKTIKWHEDDAEIVSELRLGSDFGDAYQFMVDCPEDHHKWHRLSNFVDSEALEEYIPTDPNGVSTATPLKEENMVLLDILSRKQPLDAFEDQTSKELRYTIVERSKRRSLEQTVAQVTEDALDRSWYMSSLFAHDVDLFLAELQIAFIHFIVLGNLSSYSQWMSLLQLVLKSKSFVLGNAKFSENFLKVFLAQIETIPSEYLMDTLEVQVVDLKSYVGVIDSLEEVMAGPDWARIKQLNLSRFGMEFSSTSKFDSNDFEVYDMENYDENDEDAPAIITD